jgi:NADH-ubiquinone oxidoreductase chain 5
MLLTIILFPLLGFFSGILFGRFLGKGVPFITTLLTSLSCIFSILTFFDIVTTGNKYIVYLKEWLHSEYLIVNWSFCFDSLTAIMIVVVTFISSLVHLYSTEYMENDPHLPRFMSYLSLFTFFMLILVTADNFLQMFVGWEGVGVSSYLLINFWFTRIQANKAAIKAMLVNRVGDFFLLLGMFTIYITFGSLDYDIVFNLVPYYSDVTVPLLRNIIHINLIDLICIFLLLGAMGKSAQIGLHTWLPDAMEGPTPVSALIHAATMVTAGVFLICRCSFLFEHSSFALSCVTLVGSMTAFFAATTGLFQNDMKRVIAYSTCSQLGYMIFACGLSSYELGMFHLSNHAFFKALLFLGAGSVIHAVSDEQDMRKMGGLKNILPFTYSIMLIGSLALIGFPFLAGFYSKDAILEVASSTYTNVGQFAYILGLLAAFCTAFYSTRLLFLVFLSNPNGNKKILLNAHEGTIRMTFPLFILSLLSIFVGYLSKDLFIGFGTDFWGAAVYVNLNNYVMSDIEFLDINYKLLPLYLTIFGSGLSYLIYSFYIVDYFKIKNTIWYKNLYTFFNKKWLFDRLYNAFVVQSLLKQSYYYFYQDIDRGLLENFGPSGITSFVQNQSFKTSELHTGLVRDIIKFFLIGILIFCLFVYKTILILTVFIFFLSLIFYI